MRKLLVFGLPASVAAAFVLAANALGTASMQKSTTATTVRVMTKKLPKLGVVLVNAKGMTLYMFVPDKRQRVTCVHACAAVWPPLYLPKGAKPAAGGQAKQSLLASDRDPTGGRVVTYSRWPLYTYVADTKPGQAKGQALNLNGGYWYVLSPSGKVIKTKTSSSYYR
jgi:predicted lipoprotein with Yx(FWY)xxD motif